MTKSLIIMPCAGFGTRMSLPPNQSKELLKDPYNSNKPLIDWHLDQLKEYEKVVITREEKSDLIDHLYIDPESKMFVSLMSDVSKEWPNSVLHSEQNWKEKNILILPDTRYKFDVSKHGSKSLIEVMEAELENNDIVFAVHKVPDVRTWGKVLLDPFTKKPILTREKEDIKFELEGLAWGIIGFRNNMTDGSNRSVGKELFTHYLNKTQFYLTKVKTSVIYLDSFQDITRSGKIEEY